MSAMTMRPLMNNVQADLIARLKAERLPNAEALVQLPVLRDKYRLGIATESDAARMIFLMRSLPFRASKRDLKAGVYQTVNGLVRVYLGQKNGRMLAKAVRKVDERVWFEYLGIAWRNVPDSAHLLNAQELGDATLAMNSTVCLICGRRLDDPESVQRGIGPVCFQNYGRV